MQTFFKQAILCCKFLLKNSPYRKNEVYHNIANGKFYKMETQKKIWRRRNLKAEGGLKRIFLLSVKCSVR